MKPARVIVELRDSNGDLYTLRDGDTLWLEANFNVDGNTAKVVKSYTVRVVDGRRK